jgi:dihydropteroate synthase-like protein
VRIALITSSTARELVESYVRTKAGVPALEITVIDIPVHAISMLSTETIARIIGKNVSLAERLKGNDVILVPGSVRGDTSVISQILGKPVYKASKSLALLPQVLKHLASKGSLDTVKAAENVMTMSPPPVDYVEAFKVNGVSIPLRGPPMVLSAEIAYWADDEMFRRTLSRYAGEGAQIIVVGSSFESSPESLAEKVSIAVELGYPVLAEAPGRDHAREALNSGASGLIISSDSADGILELLPSDRVLVVGDRSVERLEKVVGKAVEVGVSRIILDPVVGIPLVDLSSTVERYRLASKLGFPTLFSSANVTEEIEADSHSLHALLVVLALELGASVYHVVEDSYKTIHSVSEAREALNLAVEAYTRRESMRGYHSRLLIVKQGSRPEGALIEPGERVDYIEPRWDRRGYVRIEVNHERGVIVAAYIGYDGSRVVVEGRHGPSIARALIRRVGLEAEHAAYIGYELAKAEMALKLGKTYIQDEELLVTPWG